MGVAAGNSGAEFAPLRLDVLVGNCAGLETGAIVVGARIPRPHVWWLPRPNIDRLRCVGRSRTGHFCVHDCVGCKAPLLDVVVMIGVFGIKECRGTWNSGVEVFIDF